MWGQSFIFWIPFCKECHSQMDDLSVNRDSANFRIIKHNCFRPRLGAPTPANNVWSSIQWITLKFHSQNCRIWKAMSGSPSQRLPTSGLPTMQLLNELRLLIKVSFCLFRLGNIIQGAMDRQSTISAWRSDVFFKLTVIHFCYILGAR